MGGGYYIMINALVEIVCGRDLLLLSVRSARHFRCIVIFITACHAHSAIIVECVFNFTQ